MSFSLQEKKIMAVQDLNLEIGPDEIVVLVGETGSGKSTVSKSMLGLMPSNASRRSGSEQYFLGHLLTEKDYGKLRGKDICLIAQNPLLALNPTRRCGSQIVEVVAKFRHDVRPKDRRAEVLSLLAQCHLSEVRRIFRAYPHELSLGQLQRVNIAMALAPGPKLLIADEPFSSLDLVTKDQLLRLLSELRRKKALSMLLITHDLSLLETFADRWYVLKHGTLQGSGGGNFLRQNHQNAYVASLAQKHHELGQIKEPASKPAIPMLTVKNIRYSYTPKVWWKNDSRARNWVLKSNSFAIHRGEVFGIVGASGSGKSTLAQILGGLLPAFEGDVIYEQEPVAAWVARDRKSYFRIVQYIMQDAGSSLPPKLTMREVLHLTLKAFHPSWTPAEIMGRMRELMQSVSLDPLLLSRYRHQLSGGELQRMCVARALCAEPELLILDESLTDLDQNVQADLIQLLLYLNSEEALSIVLVAHDLRLIRHCCDRILVLKEGKIDALGSWNEIQSSDQSPYLQALIEAM